MIPKSLLTIFLSLQSLEQPARDTSSQYDVKVIESSEAVLNTNTGPYMLSQTDDVVIQAQTKYPFDSLASGDWDNNLIVDGVQITNNATARLWSLPDAFPNLKPLHGGKKAWGPYPQGQKFTIKLGKPYNDVSWTFGWLVNGRLSAGAYKIVLRKAGKYVTEGSGGWKNDQWTSWGSGGITLDQLDIEITEGIETGLLLLEYLAYGNK